MSSVTEANGSDLSPIETAKLENLELVIQDGLKHFFAVGNAMLQINQERLYRMSHSTFAEYCRDRWGMSEEYARKHMAAAETVAIIETSTNGTDSAMPANERQVRPLTRLPAEDRASAWREAVAAAPNGKPTAAIVEEELKQKLSLKVEIKLKGKERGQIVLGFESNDDFERVLRVLRG